MQLFLETGYPSSDIGEINNVIFNLSYNLMSVITIGRNHCVNEYILLIPFDQKQN